MIPLSSLERTAEELTDAGHPTTYNSSTANSYNNGVNAAKTANPNATPDQLHDAGEQSMLNDYKNGTITTGNTRYSSGWLVNGELRLEKTSTLKMSGQLILSPDSFGANQAQDFLLSGLFLHCPILCNLFA